MKALIFEQTGEPGEILRLRDIPDHKSGPGEVLVRVLLSPVHPADLHVMRGRFGRTPVLPTSPGIECVGVVEALGVGVDGPKPGTRVVLLDVWATWRGRVVAPAARVVPVPDLVRRSAQVAEIAELGGDLTLCTEDADWPAQFTRAAETDLLAKAIDCVGGRVGAAVARGLQPGGRLLVYGALSSHRQIDPAAFEMPIFVPRLIYSASSVQGWFLFHWLNVTPILEASAALRSILDRQATGQLRLPPAKIYRTGELSTALAQAESSNREGKLLIDMTSLNA